MKRVNMERRFLCPLWPRSARKRRQAFLSAPRPRLAELGLWVFLPMVLLAHGNVQAQNVPALKQPPDIGIYGNFTMAQPSLRSDADMIRGVTTGAYLRLESIVGLDVRGVLLRWGGYDHEYSALVGPRVSLHFGHVSPYASLDVGAGRAWRRLDPESGNHLTAHSAGFQWSAIGGVDLYLKPHWSVRAGEVSFSNIYAAGQICKPINYSFGLVYRMR